MALEAAEATALQKATASFSFKGFEPSKEAWDDYEFGFEQMCRAKGLFRGDHVDYATARRTLLLAWVGPEPLKVVRNHFRPGDVNNAMYDNVKAALRNYYKPKVMVFSARIDFMKRNRLDGETFAQYANVLRELADAAEYGATVIDSQLRDRFAAGIRHEKVEIEIRQRWPDGKEGDTDVTFEQVFRLAEAVERAENECARGRADGTTTVKKVQRPRGDRKKFGKEKAEMAEVCGRYGDPRHEHRSECPARDKKCRKCGDVGHFARVCRSKKHKEKDRRKQKVKRVYEDSDEDTESRSGRSTSGESSYHGSVYKSIRKVGSAPKRAVVKTRINGRKVQMDFDTGALQTTIGVNTWKVLGSPVLRRTKQLHVYGGRPIDLLGETTVDVEAFGQFRVLKMVVANVNDVPLFGSDWAAVFGVLGKMQKLGIEIKRLDPTATPTLQTTTAVSNGVKALIEEYKPLFSGEGGLIKEHQAVIRLREGATPKRFRARPVPFALKKRVEKELERLVNAGVLEKIDPSDTPIEWCSPTVNVEKKTGEVRICGDFKVTINKDLIIDEHPMPTFEEITAKLNGGQKFSIIDLKDAYLQLNVEEESRKYLVIATHMGYFRYKRCPFGISSAPQLFQYVMDQILQGLPATADFLDDIIVTGKTDEEHLQNLRAVLDRLQRAGLRTRLDKCKFLQDSITYLGHRIDASGIHPTDEKIRALRDQPAPTNISQLRSFLSFVNYYSRFISHLQPMCAPLHRLLQKGEKWEWTKEDEGVFQKLKNCLTREATLAHFDENLKLVVACDACEYGLGAALLQRYPNGTEKPIAFVSRTLSKSERNYASIDREALALVFGVTKFHQYTYGKRFVLVSDHKPLQHIFGPSQELPKTAANRLARWAILLSGYAYDIEYRPAKDNATADALSRLPLPSMERSPEEEEIASDIRHIQEQHLDDLPVDSKELKRKTTSDPALAKVLNYMATGWPEKKKVSLDLVAYYEHRDEFSLKQGVIIRQGRVVVPKACQRRILEMLHSGHLGIVATRSLARHYVWWPKMDDEIEHFVKACKGCQQTRNWPAEVPLYSWNVQDGPWDRVHIDFAGPIDGRMLFVLVDAYSKWVEVKSMKKTTSAKVISVLIEWFSRFGAPMQIVSDNGPQFTSAEFAHFCKKWGITHIRSTPYHPKTNGLAERFVQTLKHRLAASEKGTFEERLQAVLMAYRMTPQKTTNTTPAELFLNRQLPNLLDRLKPDPRRRMQTEVLKQKTDHDQRIEERQFIPGAPVWVQNERTTGCAEGTIQRQTATHSYEVSINGEVKRKHADQLRDRTLPMEPIAEIEGSEPGTSTAEPVVEAPVPAPETPAVLVAAPPAEKPPLRRSARERKPATRFGYDPPASTLGERTKKKPK